MSTTVQDASTPCATDSTPSVGDQPAYNVGNKVHDDQLVRLASLISQAMNFCSEALDMVEQLQASAAGLRMRLPPHVVGPYTPQPSPLLSPSPFMMSLRFGHTSPTMSTSEDQGSDVECDDHVKSPELPSLRVSMAFEQDTSPSLKLSVPVGDAELALDAPSSECK